MDIATRPPPYFEEQRQRLCGLHALNHAVGFRAFAEADMEAAVEIILDEASAAAHAAGVASEERRGNHVHPGGDYSEQVLAGALLARGGWVFDQVPLKQHARGYETIWDVGVVGALVHTPGHWLALRREEEDLWLLDSLQARPSYVGRKGSATVAAMLASYSSIFLARAEGVVATVVADGAEMCGQAPDPDGGEGRQGAGATSARVPVDVSAQPPATDGAEARPGRPCAAPMPACAQESTRDEAGARAIFGVAGAGLAKDLIGQDRVSSDVQELLRRFESGESCLSFLSSLPAYVECSGQPSTLSETDAWLEATAASMATEHVNSKARLDMLPYLADTTYYPLFVLCEAAADASGMPVEFLLDSFVAVAHSLLNKHFHVQLGQFESRSRYWVVGTAEPGVGKSPALDPIMQMLLEVARENASLMPSVAADDFHYMQSSTTATAVDKLRTCDGYLCLYTGEAGRCLDLAFATGGKADAGKCVDLTYFLDAAHGAEFSHQTLIDRQRKFKEKVQNPNEPVRVSETLCLNPTNMHIIWLQQELYFAKYWCVLGKQKPLGLLQRCLFSFGGQKHVYNARLNGFVRQVFCPVVKHVLTYVLRNLGPRSPKAAQQNLRLAPEQTTFVSRVRQTLALAGQRKTVPSTLRDAMPKALYWLGTAIITNNIMANAFHTLARPEAVLDAGVSDAAFKAAMRFVGRRYLRGIAVVATCIGEQLWLGIERQELSADGARLGRLVSILRKCAGSYISVTSMCRVDLELQRAALADELDVRERVLRVMVRLLFEMEALGLGAIAVAGTGQPPYLVKHSQRHLAPHTQRWLLQHRVPLDLFPLGETAVVRDGLATGRVASDGGGHADVVASRVGRAVLLTSPARGATLGASSFAFQENVSESDAGCGDGFAVPLTVEELSLARAAQTDASSASGTHDQPGREAKSPDAPVAIVARRRARVAAAAAMNIAYTDVLQEALEDRKAFKGHCVRWLRLVNMRYAVEKTCYDEERWQRVVLCRESPSCRVRVTLTYYVRATTLPAKSFVVVTRGDHDHSEQGAASGKLWSPQAEFLAREYKASAAKATVQGLLAHLHASGVPGPFPDRPRISNWLRHLKCGPSRAEQPASQHVETGRHSIEAWCEKPSEQDRTRLWVLQPYVLTGVSVRVLFASHGMLSHTLDRYDGGRVHLSVDGKWKVSDKGWAILTVSVLVKDVPRPTHLAHGVRKSVQSKATTTRALPLLQALVQSETTEDVVAVFRALAAHWESRHPDRRSLYQLVKQVHKDYAPALEAARATVFPRSRPVNDFFHLREKEKILAAKCAKLDLRHGKYVKRHFEWTMYTLTNTRFTPHPEVFSMVWQGFLVRLLTVGETQVATYLRAEYSSLVDAETVEFADTPTHVVWSPGQRLFFAPHWAGLWGVYPGTASGNQAGEALHAPWQRTLESLRTTPIHRQHLRCDARDLHEPMELCF